jgi:uncharacterized protein YbaP (TraB family)
MVLIPAKVNERITSNLKRFQKVVALAKTNDVNEADTVSIIKDILSEVLGFDKYTEITSEYAVKKTFCDLAIKKDGAPVMLIEAKAIGLHLKDDHTKQALDYGSNAGIDWIILTNAAQWKIYKIVFSKPVQSELVYEFNLEELNTRKTSDMEMIFYLCREALTKSSSAGLLDDYREQKQLLSRYLIGQILLTDDVIVEIKKTIKKISANSKVTVDDIKCVLENEVIKREIFDDERAADSKKKVLKATAQKLKVIVKSE